MDENKEIQIVVPIDKLTSEALDKLIEEFILREGTDYGHSEKTLQQKKQTVIKQLKNKSAQVVYSSLTEDTSIIRVP